MKRMVKLCSVLGIALVMAGCGASKPQTMKLALESNPTTGYSWTVTQDPELFRIDEEYQENAHDENMVGVGGQQIYTFTPETAGTTELTFTYSRPWVESDEDATVISYTVEVSNSKQIKVTSSRYAGGDDINSLPQIPEPEIK